MYHVAVPLASLEGDRAMSPTGDINSSLSPVFIFNFLSYYWKHVSIFH